MSEQIVIFDMDGTLIDSAKDITSSINYVRSTLSLEPLEVQTIVDTINSDHRNLAKIFYGTEVYQDKERDIFEAHYYDECIKNVILYPNIKELLCELRSQKVSCSIATNAPATFAKRMLSHLEVDHHFDYMLGADLHQSKPDPHMLNTILSNYGYDKNKHPQPLMVGDNKKDLQAGQNAGIDAVFVTWGFADLKVENSIDSPLQLLDLLKK